VLAAQALFALCLVSAVQLLVPRIYIRLHQTIYFSGHGTTEALTILLVYLGVTLVIPGLLNWSGTERPVNPDAAEAAAVAVPAGAAP
jgi:hypothetical protein